MGVRKDPAASGTMSRNRVLWYTVFFLLLLALTVALLWVCGHYLHYFLLTGNPRLELRRITIRSTGFWAGREKELAARLKLRCADGTLPVAADGLFTADPGRLRRELLQIPGIRECEVRRLLPDTLDFRIIERMPCAVLWKPQSPWIVDEEGVLFPRGESLCQVRQLTLPVILGYRPAERLKVGARCPGLENALELISLTLRSFPDLEIRAIDLSRSQKSRTIELFVRYRKMRECRAILPVNDRNYSFRLSELQSAILYAEQRGDKRSIFDLSYEGSAIIR